MYIFTKRKSTWFLLHVNTYNIPLYFSFSSFDNFFLNIKPILFRWISISWTVHSTRSPGPSVTLPWSLLLWIRPLLETPMSTKTPNEVVLLTIPLILWFFSSCSILVIPVLKAACSNSEIQNKTHNQQQIYLGRIWDSKQNKTTTIDRKSNYKNLRNQNLWQAYKLAQPKEEFTEIKKCCCFLPLFILK